MPLDSTGERFTPGNAQLADKNFYHIPKGSVIRYEEPDYVEEAPVDDRVYGRINRFWIPLDVVDVPEDDLLYARRNGVWVRVTAREVAIDDSNVDDELADRISRGGDSMLGNLALLSNPTNDLHAVNKQYVDRLLAGVPVIIGVFDASTGNCQFTPASGLADGPLPPAAVEIQGVYVIVVVPGTVPDGPVAGLSFNVGDWVFCDGIGWVRLAIGNIGQLPEAPLDGGFYSRRNANWDRIFQVVNATTWRLEHSLYLDNLGAGGAATFLRVIGNATGFFQVEARTNGQMGYSFSSGSGPNRLVFSENGVIAWDIYPTGGAGGCYFDKWIAGVSTRLLQILETGLSVRGNLSVSYPNAGSYVFEPRANGDNVFIINSGVNYGSRWAYRIGGINQCQVAMGIYGWNLTRVIDAEAINRPIVAIDWDGRITVPYAGDPISANELARKAYVDSHSFTEAPNDTHYYARCSATWERIFNRQNPNTLVMPWSLWIQDSSRTTTIFDVRQGGSIIQYNVSAGAARLTFQAPTLGAVMDVLFQNTAHPTWFWVQEILSQAGGGKRTGINFLKRTGNVDEVALHIDEDGYVEGGHFVTNAGDPVSDNQLARKKYVDDLFGRMYVSRIEPESAPASTSMTFHLYGINFRPTVKVMYINTLRDITFHDSTHISTTFGTGAQIQVRDIHLVDPGVSTSNVVHLTILGFEGEVEVEEKPVQKPVKVEVEDLTYVGKLEARLALLEVKFRELERKVYALR